MSLEVLLGDSGVVVLWTCDRYATKELFKWKIRFFSQTEIQLAKNWKYFGVSMTYFI